MKKISPEELDWHVFLAVHTLNKQVILRLDLLGLLNQFEDVVSSRQLSLSLEGVALWGAAYLHRIRSENIFNPTRGTEAKPKPDLIVPPELEIPIKPGMLGTTILEIVNALKKVLESASPTPTLNRTLQSDINLDNYLVKIEEELEEFIKFLEDLLSGADKLPLAELLRGVDRLEAARRFILLLLAAGRGAVELYEDEQTGGVFLRRKGSNAQEGGN
ncbi:MAG: hypothetical protein RMJ28_01665 [Nitrososphaerota archaeon]|nr:hypothetical protein [Nitrososphaerota archaeon]